MDDNAGRPTRRQQVIRATEHRDPEYVPGWLDFFARETRDRHGEALAALSMTHMMQYTMPPENVRAILETVRDIQAGRCG